MVNITIPIEEEWHDQFYSLCTDLGMDVTTTIRVFVRAAIRQRGIPFELVIEDPDPFYSPANMQRLKKSIANLEAGGGTYRELIEVDNA